MLHRTSWYGDTPPYRDHIFVAATDLDVFGTVRALLRIEQGFLVAHQKS